MAEDTTEYLLQIRLDQLIDHIQSGEPNRFNVFAPPGDLGTFDTYQKALEVFNKITLPGYSCIVLATRIGTGVTILSKEVP